MKKVYKNAKRIILLVLWLASSHALLAQERTVSGTIKDETGASLPGVNVILKGTSQGTVSDADGNFKINVTGSETVLVFSFIGFSTQEITVGSQTNVSISMSLDVKTLSEIVVTGYASQEKKDLTGSVSTVKAVDLIAIPSSNINNQLQGRIAGVTVSGDGRPGQPAKIRIRGFGSFQNNDPLYVVDGVPTQDISTLNPGDVETLSVLKDAGAASIYGSRASNGVILITTKRGTSGGIKVNYNGYSGTQYAGGGPTNMLNTKEYADLQWLVYKNDGTSETHPIYGPSSAAGPTLPSWAGDTNWYKTITRNARIMNHDLSLSGGNDKAKFYAGFNYFDQQGIVITNFSKRFTARFNSEFKIKDRVTIGENVTIAGRTENGVNGNGTEDSPVARVYSLQPIIPAIVDQNITGISHNYIPGEYGGTGIAPRLGNSPNILADLQRNAENRNNDVRIIGSTYVNVKIFDFLSFKTTFGGTFQSRYQTNWTGATYERSENVATSSYTESSSYNNDWVWTNALTFNKTIGAHRILAVGGYEAVKYGIGRGLSGNRAGYFSTATSYRTLTNGSQIKDASSFFNTPTTLASTFLRADYAYNDRYLLAVTVRRDGSSRFGESNRYGVFPSVSAGWRVSQESFMGGISFLSDLKIRGGYGTMGNQLAVSPQNQYSLYGGAISESNYDLNGNGTSSLQGFRPNRIGNPNAKWETNVTTNVGFDAGFFNNKLQVTFDWYTKQTKDLLFNPALPGTAGAADAPFINVAEMKNTGIDLQVIYKQQVSTDLSFEGNLTFTSYNNKIVKVADGIDYFQSGGSRIGSFNRNQEGHPVSSFYGYQVQGLFQSAAEVTGAATQDGAAAGFFRYKDIDGDGAITPKDRTFIGNPNPDFTYGLNLSATFKNFDVSTFFYGSQGNKIFNYNRWWTDFWPSFQNQKSKDLLYNSWTPTNTGAATPKASNVSNFSTNTQATSYYVENGSFLRLKNIQVGYRLPGSIANKIGLTSARVYVQGVNLFTVKKYKGLDPDINNGGDVNFGVDQGAYPLVKQFIVGVNLGF